MRRFCLTALVLAISGVASAADKPNPAGTWTWKAGRAGQEREQKLKLKLEGDKLTGAMIGRNDNETKIEDAKFKDGKVSFTVTRERNGKIVMKYEGKVSGDTIKGTIETERNGEKRPSRDWEAKRAPK